LSLFTAATQVDARARRSNRDRLAELAAARGADVELVCSHHAPTLERMQQAVAAAPA
jgi:threonine dehydrogenase-like Zn-dependent dehydrogenase